MSSYTSITIGGVDVFVDPESISVSTNNIVSIDRSLAGESYITSVKSNTPAKDRTVTISGAYLPALSAAALVALAASKVPVLVAGDIVGTEGRFIINSVQSSPLKPLTVFPGDSSIKYQYSVTLTEVD